MSEMIVRLAVVLLLSVLASVLVWFGRRLFEERRQRILISAPVTSSGVFEDEDLPEGVRAHAARVRILAFSREKMGQVRHPVSACPA